MQLSNKVVNGLVSVLAVIVIAFGLGCDGKSGGGDGGDGGDDGDGGGGVSYNLRVKILDQFNNPVSDVYVVLHQENGLVESYKTTDTGGIADFGDIGRDHATITVARIEEVGEDYEISSWVNIPFLTGEDNTFFVYLRDEEIATINVSTTGSGYDYVYLQPFDEYGEPSETISADVHIRDIQDDGTLSMAACGFTTEDWSFVKYGYLLDQVAGDTYTIALDKTPTEIEFSSTNGDITYLYVGMQRKGIDFQIGGYGLDVPFSSGLIKVADQLPEDYGYCMTEAWAWSYDEIDFESGKGQSKKYQTIPNPISVSMPDFSIDAVDFADSTITWTKSGSQGIDMTWIEMDFYLYSEESYKDVWWVVKVDPISYPNSWKLSNLQLPDVINAWFVGCNIDDVEVQVFDSDTATGFEDFITKRLENPDEDWASLFDEVMYGAWGYKYFADDIGGFPVNKNHRVRNDKSFHEMRGTHLFKK